MPQSHANILVHYVFSTKNRHRWITDEIRPWLHAYITGIVKNCGGTLLRVNSVEDHIHILMNLGRTITIANMVKEMKTSSTTWIKQNSAKHQQFHWQTGYGAFSISHGNKDGLIKYIDNQKEHHRTITFQEEYRRLLEMYEIQYDETYVWD